MEKFHIAVMYARVSYFFAIIIGPIFDFTLSLDKVVFELRCVTVHIPFSI